MADLIVFRFDIFWEALFGFVEVEFLLAISFLEI